jgi:hypothetical protein
LSTVASGRYLSRFCIERVHDCISLRVRDHRLPNPVALQI